MAIATFIPEDDPRPPRNEHLRRTQVAALLRVNPPAVDKLQASGVIGRLPTLSEIDPLARRPRLRVASGELTVLRTNSRTEANATMDPDDPREWIGFHVDHTDGELTASSLRWWRADPSRVLDNQLFAVTIATVPVAVFLLNDKVETHQRPGETFLRYAFGGKLLARMGAGQRVVFADDVDLELRDRAKQIMRSRIAVSSGGPIGYLEPGEMLQDEL